MPFKDPEAYRSYQRTYQNKYQWVRKLKQKFGLTEEDYYGILAAQGGGCAVCGTSDNTYSGWTRRLPVDHDHETGRVRGILCDLCNRAIGLMQDDPARLRAAADYLEKE